MRQKNSYSKLINILYNTLEKHAPLKSKTVRGNEIQMQYETNSIVY